MALFSFSYILKALHSEDVCHCNKILGISSSREMTYLGLRFQKVQSLVLGSVDSGLRVKQNVIVTGTHDRSYPLCDIWKAGGLGGTWDWV